MCPGVASPGAQFRENAKLGASKTGRKDARASSRVPSDWACRAVTVGSIRSVWILTVCVQTLGILRHLIIIRRLLPLAAIRSSARTSRGSRTSAAAVPVFDRMVAGFNSFWGRVSGFLQEAPARDERQCRTAPILKREAKTPLRFVKLATKPVRTSERYLEFAQSTRQAFIRLLLTLSAGSLVASISLLRFTVNAETAWLALLPISWGFLGIGVIVCLLHFGSNHSCTWPRSER